MATYKSDEYQLPQSRSTITTFVNLYSFKYLIDIGSQRLGTAFPPMKKEKDGYVPRSGCRRGRGGGVYVDGETCDVYETVSGR